MAKYERVVQNMYEESKVVSGRVLGRRDRWVRGGGVITQGIRSELLLV